MKKSIIFISVLTVILIVSTFAQAAGIGTSTPTITIGQNATVTVTTSVQVGGMEFTLTYDETKFDYVTNSAAGVAVVNDATPGTLVVSYTNVSGTDTLSFTFEGIAVGTGTFGITAASFTDTGGDPLGAETVTTASTTVTVEAAPPANNTTTNNTTANNTIPGEIPNAGFDFIPILIATVIAIALVAFLRLRKK